MNSNFVNKVHPEAPLRPNLKIKMSENQFLKKISKAMEQEKSLKKWLAQGPLEPLKASKAISEALNIVNYDTPKSSINDKKSL